jgi:hypothetical protein
VKPILVRILATRALRALLAIAMIATAASANAQITPPDVSGNYHDSPVFYERYDEPHYPNAENLSSLHNGWLTLPNFSPADVRDFRWLTSNVDDYSWWIQVEELRFLLPFIGSERPGDLELAEKWFDSWYATEIINPHLNIARWGEPMSAAYRGMVLVYLLKVEESRPDPDRDLIRSFRETIYNHREFLADERHFDANSNHGLVESMGLLEVTRVFPDRALEQLGLDRLLKIVETSVSEKGSHMEHAPGYHLAFMYMLDRYVEYLNGLQFLDKDVLNRLAQYRDLMRYAAYYMQDHGGTIAQIGDSDSIVVADRYPRFTEEETAYRPPVFYDAEAGFAVYKGNRTRGDRRYVVFAIQNETPQLFYHFHDDALSVYFADNGETLLGDQGKYEYTNTKERRYFVSPVAHNTVFPIEYLTTRKPRYEVFVVDTSAVESGSDGVKFSGRIRHTSADVERIVFLPKRGGMTVEDAITWSVPAGEGESAKRPLYTAMVWNVGPDVASMDAVDTAADDEYRWLLTTHSGKRYRLRISVDRGVEGADHAVEIYRGRHHPMMGWYSPTLFVKRPSPAILITLRPRQTVRVTTRVEAVSAVPFALRVLLRGY